MCCWGNILWVLFWHDACWVQCFVGGVCGGGWGCCGCVLVVWFLVSLCRGFVIGLGLMVCVFVFWPFWVIVDGFWGCV